MTEPFFSDLSKLIESIQMPQVILECKHFFSGAAVYANGKIIASYSPAGVAVKLPEEQRQRLFHEEKAAEFRFFPGGPIKKEYVLFPKSVFDDVQAFEGMIKLGVHYVAGNQAQP